MSVVTIAEAWPAAGRPFTVAELDRMPDGGRRYELLDGVLIVRPRPELTVFELRDGRYTVAAQTSEPYLAGRPFAVSVDPARLIAGLRR
jgi:hypothetical protein